MQAEQTTLARRLGVSAHVSPLRKKLTRLQERYPGRATDTLEDWLTDVANARGARIVLRPGISLSDFRGPPLEELTMEELIVAICQPHCLDRPQILRLAAQLISRGSVRLPWLKLIAERERATPVLVALAREALRVDPSHTLWLGLAGLKTRQRPVTQRLLHWTRLADPEMENGRCNATRWRLVA
ncbi:MAG: hypothetical protein EXS18_06005 [Verrucomicrobiae bacterium]|nr:hypothetical protein [Verrucomicrobiae bacterium]